MFVRECMYVKKKIVKTGTESGTFADDYFIDELHASTLWGISRPTGSEDGPGGSLRLELGREDDLGREGVWPISASADRRRGGSGSGGGKEEERRCSRSFRLLRLGPAPDLADPPCHVDLDLHDPDDPRVGQHLLGRRAQGRIDAQPADTDTGATETPSVSGRHRSRRQRRERGHYVCLMKSFMGSLQCTPASSSNCGGWT